MGVWDTSTPAGTDNISDGDDRIREMKTAIQEALRGQASEGTEAVFPGSSPSTAPVFRYRGLKGTTGARPAAGQYGLYVNTTLQTIQRDNGTSWEDVATLIPSGTKMVFAQASVPTGWTADNTYTGKIIRLANSGSGATTGGSADAASAITLAHTHTVAAHTHSTPAAPLDYTASDRSGAGEPTVESGVTEDIASVNSDGANLRRSSTAGTGTTIRIHKNRVQAGTSGSAAPATDSQLSNITLAHVNMVVGTKD